MPPVNPIAARVSRPMHAQVYRSARVRGVSVSMLVKDALRYYWQAYPDPVNEAVNEKPQSPAVRTQPAHKPAWRGNGNAERPATLQRIESKKSGNGFADG